MFQDLYHQQLLEYVKDPQNKGSLEDFDLSCETYNASCGDSVKIYLKLNKESNKIENATWLGEGCIISQAAVDQLVGRLTGLTVAEAKKIDLPSVLALLNFSEISPGRENCVTLGLVALSKL